MERRGNLEQAELYFREALDIHRNRLGEDTPLTAVSMIRLAGNLHEQEKPDAEKMHRQALQMLRAKVGNEHQDVVWGTSRLARLKLNEGDRATAEDLFRKAIQIERQLPREKHPILADCLEGMAQALIANGRAQEAEGLLAEALDIQQLRFVDGDPRTAFTRNTLGACLTALGRHEQAERLLLESHKALTTTHGPSHRRSRLASQRFEDLHKATNERSAP